MVSIVFVSHSAKIAEGTADLANQMTQGKVAVAAAGGIDDPEHPIGTDADQIKVAIESVFSEDGVVVLMDLGSAILSAEMALELLPPEQAARVHLCAAPLVEGAVVAAVMAATGSGAAAVMAEALDALAPKQAQLGHGLPDKALVPAAPKAGGQRAVAVLDVRNKLGLHARPAARLVSTAVQFRAAITVYKGTHEANAKSMNQVATLGVRCGDTVTVTAVGVDAWEALAAIRALAADNFGDSDGALPTASVPDVAVQDGRGIAAAPGVAIGAPLLYAPVLPTAPDTLVEDVAAEMERLHAAVAAAASEIRQLEAAAVQKVGAEDAAIFEAHLLILQDPDLLEDAQARVLEQQVNGAAAWQQAITAVANRYLALPDFYMQARAADVQDVGDRVLRQMLGVERPLLRLTEPAIVLAEELTPSDTAQLDPALVLGLVVARGGATSHSAILARGMGIPAVVGVGGMLAQLAQAEVVALDGRTGQIWANPDADTVADLQKQRAEWLAVQQERRLAAGKQAVTKDGRRVEVAANIGSPKEAGVARHNGAEGVGLFRTEFLFMDRREAPSEEEQLAAYVAAAAAMEGDAVIIRTLDVGGDKPLPYLGLVSEENPFLGWRGVRFCLDRPDVFKPQLRAILRAGAVLNVKMMFPMVGTLAEWRAARALVTEMQEELRREGLPFAESMEVGVMIEVPSAVVIADQLATEADFFSIGTNDLTQYVMAADRGNARVANLVNALHPAVLRMIAQTVMAGHKAGIWVGMCGELAGNAQAAPLLVGLGLDELSMSATAIPAVKTAVAQVDVATAEALVRQALALDSAAAVLALLEVGGRMKDEG